MQLWFWAAVLGAVFAGFSNFCFKIASKRNYNPELFALYGGLASLAFSGIALLIVGDGLFTYKYVAVITVVAGAVATLGGVMKVYALRYIDTTIFFPLFKLLSPLLAITAGLIFFGEQHNWYEYLGIGISLLVPLLLISNVERSRQQNLMMGLLFVILISATSALAAILNKYAIDIGMSEVVTLWYASIGVFLGSILLMIGKTGFVGILKMVNNETNLKLIFYASIRAILICFSLLLILFAYGNGGTLGVVQTIHSLYILIPIVLAIIYYHEHWNFQKIAAVGLSIIALALLG